MPLQKKAFCHLSKRQQRRILNKTTVTTTPNSSIIEHSTLISTNDVVQQCFRGSFRNEYTEEPPRELNLSNSLGIIMVQEKQSVFCEEVTEQLLDEGSDGGFTKVSELEIKEPMSTLMEDLRLWAVRSLISRVHLTKLLRILIKHGHKDLPSDSRSLLKTPRENKNIVIMGDGQYYNFGVEHSLITSINLHFFGHEIPSNIKLNINVDGVPISKSSGSQFWPILCKIVAIDRYTEPFAIGIYHGMVKPPNPQEYLQSFIEEMKPILKNGIMVNGQLISVSIKAVICDAPARAFVSGVKSHSGYFSCHKCTQEGEYIDNRVTFPETNAILRTDDSFRLRIQEEHHRVDSPLESLNIGMVTQLPLDYQHLICLGVVKKLLHMWIKGPKDIRMPHENIVQVSNGLSSFKKHITVDFARKPRSFFDVDRWKATEFRQFLLYTGPILLKNNLPIDKYVHFLSLHFAIRILISENMCQTHNSYANSLLLYFVEKCSLLYGPENVSYNIHNLIHIATDVKLHGSLDSFSTFPFENYLQKLKLKTKTSFRPLHQVVNRILEQRISAGSLVSNSKTESKTYPNFGYKYNSSDIKFVNLTKNIHLRTNPPDNVCMLITGTVIFISSIKSQENTLRFSGESYDQTFSLYTHPADSKKINIVKINVNFSVSLVDSVIEIEQIRCKCLALPLSSDEYAILPIVHTT